MNSIGMFVKRFGADQRGATAIEYGLVASLITIMVIGAATQIGQSVLGFFEAVAAGLEP